MRPAARVVVEKMLAGDDGDVGTAGDRGAVVEEVHRAEGDRIRFTVAVNCTELPPVVASGVATNVVVVAAPAGATGEHDIVAVAAVVI